MKEYVIIKKGGAMLLVRFWKALGQKEGNGILKIVIVSLLYFIS